MYEQPSVNVAVDSRGVAVVTFLHETPSNESLACLDELADVLAELDGDNAVRIVVLTGEDDHFFVGPKPHAILESRKDPDEVVDTLRTGQLTVERLISLDRPVVAAVNGPALGVGTQVALLADIAVAGRSVYFQDPHVKLGVAAGDGGMLWPLLMGLPRAKRYVMTGKRLHATEAHQSGLLAELVDDADVMDSAMAIADDFVKLPDMAVRMTKRALNQWLRMGSSFSFDYSNALQLASAMHPESIRILEGLVD